MLSIVLEGPDRCYKTTTLKKLQNKIQETYSKHVAVYKAMNFSNMFLVQSQDVTSELFLNRLRHSTMTELDMQDQIGFDVIYDRHYPSEFVYSQYYGRPSDMTLLREADKKFKSLNGTIILLRRKDYTGWSDNLDKTIDLAAIDKLYDDFVKWSENDVYSIFIDTDGGDQVDNRIQKILNIIEPKYFKNLEEAK